MAGMKINFADVQGSFEPMPEGDYDVVLEIIEVRESKSSDNDYLNWEFTVTDSEHEGRKLWMITSFSPKALFRLKDTLVNLEVIGEDDELEFDWEEDVDITPSEGPRLLHPALEGIAMVATIKNEVYDGKERNKVADISLPGVMPKKAEKKSAGSSKPAARSGRTRSLR